MLTLGFHDVDSMRLGPLARHYALARYFCLYLQEKKVLEKFCGILIDTPIEEKNKTPNYLVDKIVGLLGLSSEDELDLAFAGWVKQFRPA